MIGEVPRKALERAQTNIQRLIDDGFNPELVCVHAYEPLRRFIHNPWKVPVRLNLPWNLATSDLRSLHTRNFGLPPTRVDNDGAFLWIDQRLHPMFYDDFVGSIQGVHLAPADGKFERHFIQYYHNGVQEPKAGTINSWNDIRLTLMNTLNGIQKSRWPSLWEDLPEHLAPCSISAVGWFDVVFQIALKCFSGCPVQLSYLHPLNEKLDRQGPWIPSKRPFRWDDPEPFPGWEFRISNFATASIHAIDWLSANWPDDGAATKPRVVSPSSDSTKEASPGQIVGAMDRHIRRLAHHTRKVKDLVLASTNEDQSTLEQVNSNAAMSALLSWELNKAINDHDADFWEALPSWRETREEFWKVIGESKNLTSILATVGNGQFPTTFMLNAFQVGTFWNKPRDWNEPAPLIDRPIGFYAPGAGRDALILDDDEVRLVPCFDDVSLAVLREKLGMKPTVEVESLVVAAVGGQMPSRVESTSKSKLQNSQQKALASYQWAVLQMTGDLKKLVPDKKAYGFLKQCIQSEVDSNGSELPDEIATYKLPVEKTWGRYLRGARKLSGESKNTPRHGREYGTGIVRQGQT